MLTNVLLKNLALIKEADINFQSGLNILTGETGSGKSIIINAINIALGGKASKSLIRKGSESGLIELTFSTDREDILSVLDDIGVSRNGNLIVITRKISADASISRINGETVTLASIRNLTSRLVDIHGQHDHQSLLDPAMHISIVDSFGGERIEALKNHVKYEYGQYKELRRKLLKYSKDPASVSKEIELLRYELDEIEKAAIKPKEDEQLEKEYRQMSAWSRISGALEKALYDIRNEEKGAYYQLMDADVQLKYALDADPENAELSAMLSTIRDLESVADDAGKDIENYLNKHSFNGERYNQIRTRLDEINRLKDKYGKSISDIEIYAQNAARQLEDYKLYESSKTSILAEMEAVRSRLNDHAHKLSDARKESAAQLEPMITASLKDLNFLSADFEIDFSKNDKISENGFDRAEFLISVNPGEPPLPLAKIASGGELSRIMLALKSAIAVKDDIPTLIFDEIDTGISGKTAQMVSVKLAELSADHQVICITHLPQIAAMADVHFSINKEVSDGSTISGTVKLDKEGSVREIARLLSGEEITEISLKNAAELVQKSQLYKFPNT